MTDEGVDQSNFRICFGNGRCLLISDERWRLLSGVILRWSSRRWGRTLSFLTSQLVWGRGSMAG
jgi:hypothetical protein